MERHTDYDEQSEVLLVFNEDPEETPPQVPDPTSPQQPPPNPLSPPSQPAPTDTTNISADQSFWAEVYTLQPPHALMGILTDLHVHRFVLHQHLDSLNALTDTPIGHPPLTDTLPPPVQRLIAIYHNNVQRIQSHTRLALNAIDTMARIPPAAYFLDPNLTAQTSTSTHDETDRPPSSTSPLRFYPIPQPTALLCRTSPLKLLHSQNPSWPIHFHHFSCTNLNRPHLQQPLDQPPTTVMSRRTSTPSSSSLLLPASCPQQTTTNRQLPLPQPAILFPQHLPIPHQPPTNNHTIAGNTSTSSPHLLSLCQNSPKLHLHFHPPSAAHHATGVPRHLPAPLRPLAPASQIHAQAPQRPLAVPQASTALLQSTHFQSDHHRRSLKPYSNTLPPNPFSLFPRQLAGLLLTADLTRQHPQWHHQQPLLHLLTRGQHITPSHHSNPPLSSHHRLALPP